MHISAKRSAPGQVTLQEVAWSGSSGVSGVWHPLAQRTHTTDFPTSLHRCVCVADATNHNNNKTSTQKEDNHDKYRRHPAAGSAQEAWSSAKVGSVIPNFCDNTLRVVGEPAEVKKFVEACKNPNYGKKNKTADSDGKFRKNYREWLIFEGNFPCPQGKRDTKWGTKWGDCDTNLADQGKNGAKFRFTTAWSPGSEGLRQISALYPELAFMNAYEEPGCDFIGCDAFYRGKTIYSGSGRLPEGPDNWDDPDLDPDPHYDKIERVRDKWARKAVAKLAKKSSFHGKKLKAMV